MENKPDNIQHTEQKVTLWDVLTLGLVFGAAIGGTTGGASDINGKLVISSYFWILLTVGCLVGVFCVRAIRTMGRFMFEFIDKSVQDPRYLNWSYSLVYLWALIWCIVSALLGFLCEKILRLIF
ncbi:MAG: hypothetical protein PHP00_00235 [Thiotrichaceae bacterium]|nr:hypothetical protein [Thiotrichaceae bacterium]